MFYQLISKYKTESYNNKESENNIKSLKPKTTYEYDEIPTNLLKICSVYISSPM